jgi:nitrate reductase NapE component
MNDNPKTFVKNNNLAQVKYSKLRDGILSINLLSSETINNTISFFITYVVCMIIILILALISFIPGVGFFVWPFLCIMGPIFLGLLIKNISGAIFNTIKIFNLWRGLPTWDSIFKYQIKDHNVFQNAKFKFNMYKAILKTDREINVFVS